MSDFSRMTTPRTTWSDVGLFVTTLVMMFAINAAERDKSIFFDIIENSRISVGLASSTISWKLNLVLYLNLSLFNFLESCTMLRATPASDPSISSSVVETNFKTLDALLLNTTIVATPLPDINSRSLPKCSERFFSSYLRLLRLSPL